VGGGGHSRQVLTTLNLTGRTKRPRGGIVTGSKSLERKMFWEGKHEERAEQGDGRSGRKFRIVISLGRASNRNNSSIGRRKKRYLLKERNGRRQASSLSWGGSRPWVAADDREGCLRHIYQQKKGRYIGDERPAGRKRGQMRVLQRHTRLS